MHTLLLMNDLGVAGCVQTKILTVTLAPLLLVQENEGQLVE